MELYTGGDAPDASGPPSVAGDRASSAPMEVDEDAPIVVEGQLTTFREGRDKQRLSVSVVTPAAPWSARPTRRRAPRSSGTSRQRPERGSL